MPRAMYGVLLAVVALLVATSAANGAVGDDSSPIFEGTRTETFLIGPFDLAASGSPGDQVNRLFDAADRPEGNIAIRSIDWAMVDGDGNQLDHDDAHLHHVVLLDSAKPDQLCSFGARFAGTGAELNGLELSDGYAYRSPAGSAWQSVYHLINRAPVAQTVAVSYTVTYSDARVDDYDEVDPFFFDVDGCWGDSEFRVPGDGGPGSVFETSNSYTVERDSVLVAGGGHLHAGGIDLALTEADGNEICRSTAVHNPHGHLTGIIPCGIIDYPVAQNDQLTLTARYENDEFIPNAMGIMLMYVHQIGPPPPAPTIEVTVDSIDADGLRGSVVCNRAGTARLYGSVEQTKGGVDIDAWTDSNDSVSCGIEPTEFSLPLRGNGILTGGAASYYLSGSGSFGRQYIYVEAEGDVRVRGRVDLGVPWPDDGPVDLQIDGPLSVGDNGTIVVPVVFECSTSLNYYEVSAQVEQRFGRQYLQASGYVYGDDNLVCVDGQARIDIVTSSYGGERLTSGPVTVSLWMYDYDDYERSSNRTVEARLQGTVRPGDSNYGGSVEPDPASPLQIVGFARRDGVLFADLTYEGCAAGWEAYVSVTVNGAQTGNRAGSPSAYGWDRVACTSGAVQLSVPIDGATMPNRVDAWAIVDAYAPNYDDYTSTVNSGRFRVDRNG